MKERIPLDHIKFANKDLNYYLIIIFFTSIFLTNCTQYNASHQKYILAIEKKTASYPVWRWNGIIPFEVDEKWGFVDLNGNKIAPAIYDEVEPIYQTDKKVRIDDKWGIINSTGGIVIPIEYENVDYFHSAYPPTKVIIKKNNKWGLFELNGKNIIPCKYDSIGTIISDSTAQIGLNNKYGYINFITGIELIPPIYDYTTKPQYGGIKVKLGDKFGLIDMNRNVLIPIKYQDIQDFDYIGHNMVKLNDKWGVVDASGKVIVQIK